MPKKDSRRATLYRALLEISFIIFLFYSNLLMGEFNRSSHKTLSAALHDMVTPTNFMVGLAAALIGYLGFEFVRKRL